MSDIFSDPRMTGQYGGVDQPSPVKQNATSLLADMHAAIRALGGGGVGGYQTSGADGAEATEAQPPVGASGSTGATGAAGPMGVPLGGGNVGGYDMTSTAESSSPASAAALSDLQASGLGKQPVTPKQAMQGTREKAIEDAMAGTRAAATEEDRLYGEFPKDSDRIVDPYVKDKWTTPEEASSIRDVPP